MAPSMAEKGKKRSRWRRQKDAILTTGSDLAIRDLRNICNRINSRLMTTELLERLLHESESPYLDFKRQQYVFVGASDDDKCELLKDILAFANAWRRTDAYILIGVQELKGERGIVTGVTWHFDDATLQQFVNSKTQRAIDFSVETVTVDQHKIDVIKICGQRRPFYLKKDYGKLKAGAVYFRRGTSTAEANPDEIAAMGAEALTAAVEPNLQITFARKTFNLWGGRGPVEHLDANLSVEAKAFDPSMLNEDWPLANSIEFDGHAAKSLPKRLEWSRRIAETTRGFNFAVSNTGQISALNVETHLVVRKGQGLVVMTDASVNVFAVKDVLKIVKDAGDFVAKGLPFESKDDHWRIKFRFDRILPGYTAFSEETIHFASVKSGSWQIEATTYADNLQNPKKQPLVVQFKIAP